MSWFLKSLLPEKWRETAVGFVVFIGFFSFGFNGGMSPSAQGSSQPNLHGAIEWPHLIPCRIHEGANKDLFVMTLGNVKTSLADGMFNPVKDEVILNDGTVIENYYRDSLGIKFYKPIDKSVFPLPPSGWCSWYYYYQDVDEKEIERNAKWIADNLKDYGARYIQIDDGWQGKGHGSGDNRDWTTIDKRFSGGMDKLAAYIKSLGLKPGLWLAPHGQSNPEVVGKNPGAFILSDDTSASKTWEGNYLVDPSTSAGLDYLKNLFATLAGWGYDYFKIDGQPIVIDEYHQKKSFMRHPSDNADSLYRATIETIRRTIGNNRYLLGCWGIPLDGIGIMNGSRTGDDVDLGWGGFNAALDATMQYYFLHNIVWYCDPDVMLLRYPLTLNQARAWATLQGLTGEALMASDRMMDLSSERVGILKRVFPAVDIRPLDLFPSKIHKHIWDLKINHLGKDYDVVGLFNYDESKSKSLFLRWKDLGYEDTSLIHVFDFWNKEYLGSWQKGVSFDLPPASCRVFTLMKDNGHIQLISTNRHITQGYVDLASLKFDEKTNTFHGESKVVANNPYELYFAFPRGENFVVKSVKAGDLKAEARSHQGWAEVKFNSPKTGEVEWEVSFAPTDYYHFSVAAPYGLTATNAGLDGVTLKWDDQYYLNAGCEVFLSGELAGCTPTNRFSIGSLDVDKTYDVAVRSVWEDGTLSKRADTTSFVLRKLLPGEMYLSEVEPVSATSGWGSVEMNKSVTGKKISVGGREFEFGIGTHANSVIDFDVHGLYGKFSAVVGIDDNNGSDKASVMFAVYGDGKEMWHSDSLTKSSGAIPVSIDIKGVERLVLKVTAAGKSIDYDHADWADAKLEKLTRH